MTVMYLGLCAIAVNLLAAACCGPVTAYIGTAVCAAAGLAGLAIEASKVGGSARGRDARLTASLGALAAATLLLGDPDPMSSDAAMVRWCAAAAVGAWVWGVFSLRRLTLGSDRRDATSGSELVQAGRANPSSGHGAPGLFDVLACLVYLAILWGAWTGLCGRASFGSDLVLLTALGIAVLAGVVMLAVIIVRPSTPGQSWARAPLPGRSWFLLAPASVIAFVGCMLLCRAATFNDVLAAKEGALVIGYSFGMMTFGALVAKPLAESAGLPARNNDPAAR